MFFLKFFILFIFQDLLVNIIFLRIVMSFLLKKKGTLVYFFFFFKKRIYFFNFTRTKN